MKGGVEGARAQQRKHTQTEQAGIEPMNPAQQKGMLGKRPLCQPDTGALPPASILQFPQQLHDGAGEVWPFLSCSPMLNHLRSPVLPVWTHVPVSSIERVMWGRLCPWPLKIRTTLLVVLGALHPHPVGASSYDWEEIDRVSIKDCCKHPSVWQAKVGSYKPEIRSH